jgi:WD40 repeat protein
LQKARCIALDVGAETYLNYSPMQDGTVALVACSEFLRLAPTGELLTHVSIHGDGAVRNNDLSGIALSSDGRYIITTGGPLDRQIRLFSTEEIITTGRAGTCCTLETPSGATEVAFHPRETVAACLVYPSPGSPASSRVQFLRLDGGNGTISFDETIPSIMVRYHVYRIAFSSGGRYLGIASGEVDDGWAGTNGEVAIYDATPLGRREHRIKWQGVYYNAFCSVLTAIVFSPVADRGAIIFEDKFRLLDLPNGANVGTKRNLYPYDIAFLPGAEGCERLATGTNEGCSVFDTRTLKRTALFRLAPGLSGSVRRLTYIAPLDALGALRYDGTLTLLPAKDARKE